MKWWLFAVPLALFFCAGCDDAGGHMNGGMVNRGMIGGQVPIQGVTPSELPDIDTEEGRAFQQYCSQCHAMPNPRQHNAVQWPAVVERMKNYMEVQQKQVPKDDQLNDIIRFLQEHAG